MTAPLDAEIAALATASAAAGLPPITAVDPAEARRRTTRGDALVAAGPHVAHVDDVDAHGVPVRVYRPTDEPLARVILYVHGGGWVTGDLETLDGFCREVAAACETVVVSVDYRLAPEHPHPAALDDVATVWSWIASTDTGGATIPGARAGMLGDSSGGNLVSVQATRVQPSPAFLALLYPVVDHDLTRPSYIDHADAFPLGTGAMGWFWDHYVPAPGHRADPTISPIRCTDIGLLPPTLVVVAGHDPLHDEGLAYARAARDAGVPVDLLEQPTLPHSFLRLTAVSAAARAGQTDVVAALRRISR